MGKRRKTSQSEEVRTVEGSTSHMLWTTCPSDSSVLYFILIFKFSLSSQEEASRGVCDDRPSVPTVLAEKKMDSSNVGNHNKVKVMATQLLAKFEENAPVPQTGLKRQVRNPSFTRSPQFPFDLKQKGLQSHEEGSCR